MFFPNKWSQKLPEISISAVRDVKAITISKACLFMTIQFHPSIKIEKGSGL